MLGIAISKNPDSLRLSLRNLNSLLLIPFAFTFPMWIAPTYILAGLIILLWLIQGNFRIELEKIRGNKLVWALVAYLLLHIIGLLWTENIEEGPNKVARASLFLLVPVFMMVLKDEHVEAVIWSFLSSMILSCILSYLIYFRVDPNHFWYNSQGDPIMFISRVYYTMYLVIAIAFSLYGLLFNKRFRKSIKIALIIVSLLLTFDLFICNGRAGQVIYFLLLVIVAFQYFGKRKLLAFISLLIVIPSLFAIAYKTVQPFRERVQLGVEDILQYHENKATSLGQRFVYAKNSFEIFSEHPIIGVGTGDFESEVEKVHRRNSPEVRFDVDPHNMFLLEMGQFGTLGLISMLWIFLSQINIALHSDIPFQKYLGISLSLMFAIVNFSDIYLQLHFTSMLFIFASTIVYRDWSLIGQTKTASRV